MQERRQSTNPFDIPRFREEFRQSLADTIEPITKLVEKHENELQLIKAEQNRQKGESKVWGVVVGSLWGLIIAAVDVLFHRKP